MRRFIRRHRDDLIWIGWLLFFAIAEGAAIGPKRDKDTLSERIRLWFRTNSTTGRVAFGTAWVGFAVWFFWHILFQNPA